MGNGGHNAEGLSGLYILFLVLDNNLKGRDATLKGEEIQSRNMTV